MTIDEEKAKTITRQFLGQYHNVVKIDAVLGGGKSKGMETFSSHR
ncbi:MAG: hypothetical protein ACRDFB_07020 [Rhabdochlamydiaceae bacterium]